MTYGAVLFGSRIAFTNFRVAAAISISVNTENWMKLLRTIWVLVALMIVTPLAQADGTTKMEFTGVNGANNGVYYVSPYTAIMNYGNGSVNPNLGGTNPQTLYEEAAWLVTQFASHSGDYVSLQYALWDLMTPGAEPTNFANADGTTAAQWLALAAANYGQINPANFMIITNTGTLTYKGQVQEFIVQTPEPATAVLLLIGVFSIFLLTRRNQHQSA